MVFGKKSQDVESSTASAKDAPTVGRIVDFHVEDRHGGAPQVRPAMVVRVWDGGLVNLQVFTDGENDGLGNVVHRTSVAEGTDVGQWSWPARK